MNYHPKSRSRNHHTRAALILAAVFVVGGIIFYFLNGVLVSVTAPLWKVENRVTTTLSAEAGIWHSRQALLAENARLKERVSSLELELSARTSLPEEESAILALLGRRAETGGIAAATLVTPPQTPYDLILIDAGTSESVRVGAPVFLPEGPLLGTVSEVFSGTAKVLLLSAPGEKINAVLERHDVAVVLEGVGGGNFKIILPRETAVEVGDRILSADLSASLVAIVGEVVSEPTDSFKEVLARSPANIFSIRFVIVRP